ncbi:MAG TPA: hypoxanthine phosphoribosyltransferase [Dehalococcoidia bacterium]|nr:hypoxanthine phosphoribosyltransferase [Dehalococcoidia bacterium]
MTTSRARYCSALQHIVSVANSGLTLRRTCNAIAKAVAKATDMNGCRVLLLDPKRNYLTTVGAFGLSDLYLRKGPLMARQSLPEVLEGNIAVVTHAPTDKRLQHPDVAESQHVNSIAAAPILRGDETIGELRIYSRESRDLSTAEKDFLRSAASVCSVVLERAELQQFKERVWKARERSARSPVYSAGSGRLRSVEFAHESEAEFANLLDFYQIEWLYEPRSFPLAWNGSGVSQMFTPDFYLPELDMYLELTTMKQDLITEKNRKVRKLREMYPDINIRLVTKKDFVKLLSKYGYGPGGDAKVEGVGRVLYSSTQIQRRVRSLARQISKDYEGKTVVVVGILKGVVCFLSDLIRHMSIPVKVDYMDISHYGGDGEVVKITRDLDNSIADQHVLMVEDIVDTGMTLNYVLSHLRAHKPASLRVCTLLDRKTQRLANVKLDYVGFEIPDEFLVGYGLDYKDEYRNLPFIGILTEKQPHEHDAEGTDGQGT